jgi:hypothetical protein
MMMGNKGTFSAGDMAKQGMRQGPRRPVAQQKGAATSLGYTMVEGLLETEDFKKINDGYESIRQQAEVIVESPTQSARNKKRARSAVDAYDRALELLKELLEIKAQMLKG